MGFCSVDKDDVSKSKKVKAITANKINRFLPGSLRVVAAAAAVVGASPPLPPVPSCPSSCCGSC